MTDTSNTAMTQENLLVTKNSDDKTMFMMFTDEWLSLQNMVTAALQLPISQGDFDTKYGTFTDEAAVVNCVNSFKDLQGSGEIFGNPAQLLDKIVNDPTYLNSKPAELYGQIVWLASEINDYASNLNDTFDSLKDLLDPKEEPDKNKRAQNLKDILGGDGGMASQANKVSTETENLIADLGTFLKGPDGNGGLIADQKNIDQYAGSSSPIMTDAKAKVSHLTDEIATLTTEAADTHKEWEDYTISAVTTSVGITVLSGGLLLPVGAAAGTGLGIKASALMKKYNHLCDEISQDEDNLKGPTQLVTDLAGLNEMMPNMVPAVNKVVGDLEEIEGTFATAEKHLNNICTKYTVDQLSDLKWVQQCMDIEHAQTQWKNTAEKTDQFSATSLVSFVPIRGAQSSTSLHNKLGVLPGLAGERATSVKCSLIVAWEHYRDAYYS